MITVLCYKKCTTCQKAFKWLDANGVEYKERAIKEENPTYEELKTWYEKSGLPLILVAFLIAALIRSSVGAAVVAMTMAAGIMASMPAVQALSPVELAAMVCAINGGATAFSHVNDSGFWLVGSLLEIDEKSTLKSWTIMETIIGVVGLVCALVISIFA